MLLKCRGKLIGPASSKKANQSGRGRNGTEEGAMRLPVAKRNPRTRNPHNTTFPLAERGTEGDQSEGGVEALAFGSGCGWDELTTRAALLPKP